MKDLCPVCDEELDRDEVDIGVGTLYGPPRCNYCGWQIRSFGCDTRIDGHSDLCLDGNKGAE